MIAAFSITVSNEVQAALGAFLGVLVGAGASAWTVRELSLRSMTMEFEVELEDALERTRRGRVVEQESTVLAEALAEIQQFEAWRAWITRVLLGYGALVLLAGASISLLVSEVPLRAIFLGLVASAALGRVLFSLGRHRRISVAGPSVLEVAPASAALRGLQFETRVKQYLEHEGYVTRRVEPDLGVDLIVEKDGRRLAVEAKARQNLSRRDVDAALGAFARLRHSGLDVDGFVLVVPKQASARAGHLDDEARREGVEVIFLDPEPKVASETPQPAAPGS